jgi:hypothetical protein
MHLPTKARVGKRRRDEEREERQERGKTTERNIKVVATEWHIFESPRLRQEDISLSLSFQRRTIQIYCVQDFSYNLTERPVDKESVNHQSVHHGRPRNKMPHEIHG